MSALAPLLGAKRKSAPSVREQISIAHKHALRNLPLAVACADQARPFCADIGPAELPFAGLGETRLRNLS